MANEILEDLYLGKHPLNEIYNEDGSIDTEKLTSPVIENLIPSYFR